MKTTRRFFSNGIALPNLPQCSVQRLLTLLTILFLGFSTSKTTMLFAQSDITLEETVVDIDPPASYTRGNFNTTIEIKITNSGDDTLSNIKLENNLLSFGLAFENIISGGAPAIFNSTAEENPTIKLNYNGVGSIEIFDGTNGKLAPGQYIVVQIVIEINTFAGGLGQFIQNNSKVTAVDINLVGVSDISDYIVIPTNCNTKYAASMTCNGKVNLSLGKDCGADIVPSMFLEGEGRCDMFFELMFTDKRGNVVDLPIDQRYHEQTITVKVIDAIFGNSCWGSVYVEDKFGPIIECDSLTIYCNELDSLPFPNVYDNCDPNPELYMTGIDAEKLNCDSLYVKKVTRYFRATDVHGATSTCEQVILLKRIPLDSVVYPLDFSSKPNILACNGKYPLDAKGRPSTDTTGVPTIHGLPIYPYNHYCNLSVSYEDREIVISNCKTKIIRLWTVVDWNCKGTVIGTWPQTIMITDEEGPVITCPSDITATTKGGYKCEGEIWLPEIAAYDSCSHHNVTVDISYPGGVLHANGGRIVLPYGDHVVTYTVYDECYNYTQCDVNIHIEDITPPVTVCEGHTTVSINQTGEVHIYAEVLDDGTFDDCGLDRIAIKRMDEGLNCNAEDTLFMPYARFCCEDAGDTVMVTFRAWDIAGNYNDCMIEVIVQDKLAPVISCPPDVKLYCDDYIDTTDLSIYGSATTYDNCGDSIIELVDYDISACMTGVITRTFIVIDKGGRTDTCRQRIEIRDNDPFDSTDIDWPIDYEVDNCGHSLHPDSLPSIYGKPTFVDDDCSLVGLSYEDDIFEYIPGSDACFKIVRKWKVIDWCNFRYTNGGVKYTRWEHHQVIKVTNSIDPVFTTDCTSKSICTYDPDCKSGEVILEMSATDDCTPDSLLRWEYHIDLFNDKIYDTVAIGIGNYMNASNDYPIGKHTILWQFEDFCGNITSCLQEFEVVNCKPPTPYCKNGIITDLMPIDTNNDGSPDIGMIEIWASDLNDNSSHPCGAKVVFSFSSDTTDKFRTFNCDSLGRRRVEIWVTSEGSGEQDYCITYVEIQDNNKVCTGTISSGTVSGAVYTMDKDPVSDVELKIDQLSNLQATTKNDGLFDIYNVPLNRNYTVSASRKGDVLDGISTRDLVMIQNHLLGKKNLNSPYKMLAADVNKSNSVSTSDISMIRKLILGKITEYPKTSPWLLIPNDFNFSDPDNPFLDPIPSILEIQNMSGNMVDMDFVGIKMGDLNGDAMSNGFSMPKIRSGSVKLELLNQSLQPHITSWIPVYLKEETLSQGWQMSIKYDLELVDVIGLESGSMEIRESDYAIHSNDGIINISWVNAETSSFNSNDPVFYLGVKSIHTTNVTDVLTMNYKGLADEWYNSLDEDVSGIQLGFREIYNNNEIIVTQNIPNPFSTSTSIHFSIHQIEEVEVEVLDCTSKRIHYIKASYNAGSHKIKIDRNDINGAAGIYYYRVRIGEFNKSFKMVVID